ncbi:unnamed protein product [Diatraea saccharalis]|uniref:Uncharacterized protein n=1 Tax=Diatraea saccharalis TaxID=40085 RepID=A0A9N9WER5_9NEOP|nr:unnamed protein product [Diatraea saccharalis]
MYPHTEYYLYIVAKTSRSENDAPVWFEEFAEGYHMWICNEEKFPTIVNAILVTGASLTASLLVVQVAVIPLLFKYSKAVQRKMVFSNCINYPRNLDYDNPSSCNVIGGRSFKIEFDSKVDNCPIKIGVWHIVPCCMFRDVFVMRDYSRFDEKLHEELTRTQNTVVLYCHERGVVEDAFQVYNWLLESLNKNHKPTILLWGHSLGTAVIANLSANFKELCDEAGKNLPPPDAIVLEAPFNNLTEEILVSWLPYYKDTFVKPFAASSEYSFNTDQYLVKVPQLPVLMLHSKGDKIVPYDLAVKLYQTVSASRSEVPNAAVLKFHSIEKDMGIGHNNLCECPQIRTVVRSRKREMQPNSREWLAAVQSRHMCGSAEYSLLATPPRKLVRNL